MALRRSHKSTEGLGLEDVRHVPQPVDDIPQDTEWASDDHDESSKKILKAAVGGAAVGGLLTGAFLLAQHRLNKNKEK